MTNKTRKFRNKTGAVRKPLRPPVFRNIRDIRSTPRIPVIPFFTASQWKAATKGIRTTTRGKIDPAQVAVRFQSAPWGGGAVIAYPDVNAAAQVGMNCVPILRMERMPGSLGSGLVFGYELCAPEPRLPFGRCELIIRAFPGSPSEGISPWDCDQGDCTGRCELVLVGGPGNGQLQCQCKASL